MSLLDTLGELLGGVGNVLDMPGSYARGALAGRFGERLGGRDLLEHWGVLGQNQDGLDFGDVAGFGAEMLLDPLNLAMPFAGKALGKMALSRPLGYGGGASKLDDIAKNFNPAAHSTLPEGWGWMTPGDAQAKVSKHLNDIRSSPGARDILSEIAPDAELLGVGAEGVVFKNTPTSAVRIEPLLKGDKAFGRPNVPELLQPRRSVAYPGAMVEHLPIAQNVGSVPQESMDDIIQALGGRGFKYPDAHPGNFGTYQGKPYYIDKTVDYGRPDILATTPATPTNPGALSNAMMEMMGYGRFARNQAAGRNPMNPMWGIGGGYNVGRQFGGS